jgi:ribosome maturation factor RimP
VGGSFQPIFFGYTLLHSGKGWSGFGQEVGREMSWQASVERTVTGLGFDLVDVERSARGLLRVYIDRIPGRAYPQAQGTGDAVTVDDCELVTRQLLLSLEVDGIPFERLEVSSPGIDRVLKRESDFERFAGVAVDVTLKEPFQGRKHWRGQLGKAEGGWSLALDGDKSGEVLNFRFDEVREARLVPVIDFKRRGPGARAAG